MGSLGESAGGGESGSEMVVTESGAWDGDGDQPVTKGELLTGGLDDSILHTLLDELLLSDTKHS